MNSSMCSTECRQYVFLTGGEYVTTVERFDLRSNKMTWQVMPSLNVARSKHASCSLGSKVFVFGGTPKIPYYRETLNSIERFNNEKPEEAWEIIRLKNEESFIGRVHPIVCKINA